MKFTFDKIPDTVEEFKTMPNFSFKQPQNTAALFLVALCRYVENQNMGIDMINALKGPEELSNHAKSFLWDRLRDKLYLPYSYFEGSNPANNYTPTEPYTVEIFDDKLPPVEPNYIRVFVRSSGADSLRPLTLRKKGEEYFLWDYPGIVSGIRISAKEDPWA